jgi:hypothetical protein
MAVFGNGRGADGRGSPVRYSPSPASEGGCVDVGAKGGF